MSANKLLVICLVLLSHLPVPVRADACLSADGQRPQIALVLGGGGARGFAHIGVIRGLEELRVPVDYIAGTSMGALIGGMMAIGMPAPEIEEVATTVDWGATFSDNVPRQERPFRRKRDDALGLYAVKIGLAAESSVLPRAAITGQNIDFLIESIVGNSSRSENFDDLPIPFRAVAADILAAEVVVLDHGSLADAMRASMSLPAIFDPVEYGDRLLVDGGVLMNLPVSVGREMGGDVVIAVNVGEPLAPKDKVKNILQILYQLTGVVTLVNTREQIALLGPDDILLVPPISSEIGSGSFASAVDAIESGYQAVMSNRDRFSRLALSESGWQIRRGTIEHCMDGPPVIEFVRIDNRSRLSDAVIRRHIHIEPGERLDLGLLEQDIKEIHALGFLQSVQYKVIADGAQSGLEIKVLDDARGTDLFEYGFGVNSTSKVSNFKLRSGFLKTNVGERGGEFRGLLQIGQELGALAELWYPLDDSLRYFLLPQLIAEQFQFTDFDSAGNKLRQFEVTEYLLNLSIGREFGNAVRVTGGIRLGSGSSEVTVGDPNIGRLDFNRGEYLLRVSVDTQDNRFFPGRGNSTEFSYIYSDGSLGATHDFRQLAVSSSSAWTGGRHSMLAGFEYDVSFDDVIPVQNQFLAGGFPRLSGFEYDELIGDNFGMAFLGYRYQLLQHSLFPGYVGATVEFGNVAENRSEVFRNGIWNGSAYFGIDSIIGPLYLGVGVAENGRQTVFLSIGSIFSRDTLIR